MQFWLMIAYHLSEYDYLSQPYSVICPQGTEKYCVLAHDVAAHLVQAHVNMCEDSSKNVIAWISDLLAFGLD